MADWVVSPLGETVVGGPISSGPMTGVVSPAGVISIIGTDFSGRVFRYFWRPGAQWQAENVSTSAVVK
jgi:hypothetical protein